MTERWRQYMAAHPEKRNMYRQRNYSKTQGRARQNGHWAGWEDDLALHYPGTDRELSDLLERSVQAIQLRRYRLRRSEEEKVK